LELRTLLSKFDPLEELGELREPEELGELLSLIEPPVLLKLPVSLKLSEPLNSLRLPLKPPLEPPLELKRALKPLELNAPPVDALVGADVVDVVLFGAVSAGEAGCVLVDVVGYGTLITTVCGVRTVEDVLV
jgi:hypothetical protein